MGRRTDAAKNMLADLFQVQQANQAGGGVHAALKAQPPAVRESVK
jgi:hypothetical protein